MPLLLGEYWWVAVLIAELFMIIYLLHQGLEAQEEMNQERKDLAKNHAETYLRMFCMGLFRAECPKPDGVVAEICGSKMRIVSYKIGADNQSEIDKILLNGELGQTEFNRTILVDEDGSGLWDGIPLHSFHEYVQKLIGDRPAHYRICSF